MHIRKVTMPRLTRQDFERLLEFRVTLRRFQRWSEDQAQAEGLTHVQHQLLVAIKGHHENQPPTMGDLAGYLLLRPHSTVELVDRAEAAGLVERTPDGEDGRVVRVRLTREGDRVLNKLTRAHLKRLHELATVLDELVSKHDASHRAPSDNSFAVRDAAGRPRAPRMPASRHRGARSGQPVSSRRRGTSWTGRPAPSRC